MKWQMTIALGQSQKSSITKISLKITSLKFHSNLAGAKEFNALHDKDPVHVP